MSHTFPIVEIPQPKRTPQETQELIATKDGDGSNAISWQPRPQNIPQQTAYHSEADRLFYGGAAGGGKTDLLLGLAFTAHLDSIIFRREYPQVAGLEDRAREIASGVGRYNSIAKRYTGLPGSRTIEFGAVQYEKSVEKFQGRPHDLIGFDELPHFTRFQFEFLTGWNRSTKGARCRVVAAGNPPTTPEGGWVKQYWGPWLDKNHPMFPHPPGELLWFITISHGDRYEDRIVDGPESVEMDGESYEPHSRTFIPAKLSDNPDLANTGYRSVLMAMPEPLRSQMLYGSFDVKALDHAWQVIPTAWVEAAQERWKERPKGKQTSLGVDVARGGQDQTILAPLHGWHYDELVIFDGTETPNGPKVAAQVMKHLASGAVAMIDIVGVGSSVYDCCEGSVEAYGVSVGSAAESPTKKRYTDAPGNLEFVNLRSWIIWRFRELLDPNSGVDMALPPDSRLAEDLCAARYEVKPPKAGSTKSRIAVESKDDIKKRLGRSPDRGDAVQYAAVPVEHFKRGKQYRESRAYW